MSANQDRGPAQLLQYADLGMRLALCIAGLTYGGYRLDQWLDCSPIFLIAGSLLGMAAGMWSVISAVQRMGTRKRGADVSVDADGSADPEREHRDEP